MDMSSFRARLLAIGNDLLFTSSKQDRYFELHYLYQQKFILQNHKELASLPLPMICCPCMDTEGAPTRNNNTINSYNITACSQHALESGAHSFNYVCVAMLIILSPFRW